MYMSTAVNNVSWCYKAQLQIPVNRYQKHHYECLACMTYLCVYSLCVFQYCYDVSHHADAHIIQVLLGEIQQHVLLDAVVCENNGIVGSFACGNTSLLEELQPLGGHWYT